MNPVRYRWDIYGDRKRPGPWVEFFSWARMNRAIRALRLPQERIRCEYPNGQVIIVKPIGQRRPTKADRRART